MPEAVLDYDRKLDTLEADRPLYPAELDLTIRQPELVAQKFGRVLHYFGRVEGEVARNVEELKVVLPNASDHMKRFWRVWNEQEEQHGLIFEDWQQQLGLEPADTTDTHVRAHFKLAGLLSRVKSLGADDIFLYNYLMRGAKHERLTATGYKALEGQLDNPDSGVHEPEMVEVVKRITPQEARHLGVYVPAAKDQRKKLGPTQLCVAEVLEVNGYKGVGVATDAQKHDFADIMHTLVGDDLIELAKPVQKLGTELLRPEKLREMGHHEASELALVGRGLVRVIHRLTKAKHQGRDVSNFVIHELTDSLAMLREGSLANLPVAA